MRKADTRRTKIVATFGPALDTPEAFERAFTAGIDVLRVNLSHQSPRQLAPQIARVRERAPDIAILADLGGPKLRLGTLPQDIELRAGDAVRLGAGGIPVDDPSLYARVRAGDPVYLADGTIFLEARAVAGDAVDCTTIVGGIVRSRKGINLPADESDLPCLTDKDRSDLVDIELLSPAYVALSYVRHERDIEELRRLTKRPIISKVEKQQALERMDAIVAASDAVMVARGDLGVEIPIERVPAAQKRLIRACNLAGRPVITATQMLVSMVSTPLPTRAEVTDVANSVLDGTDAVMLSEETAVGRDPAAAVGMMSRIIHQTELLQGVHETPTRAEEANAIAYAAAKLAEDVDAAGIVAPTRTGLSAQRLSAFRPRRPILAYSRVPETTRKLRLVWGVTPIDLAVEPGQDPITATLAAARRDLPSGSRIVLLDIAPTGARSVASLVNVITL